MDIFINILNIFWIYGGAYFAALATACSFFALFFFFWTRTGDRKFKVDMETKKIYLHAIYFMLRLSLAMIILSKVVEVFMMKHFASQAGIDASVLDIILSHNGLFIYMLLLLIAINSFAMQKGWIKFWWALPFAIVSYFFLFLHMTSRTTFMDLRNFFIPAGDVIVIDMAVYVGALVIGTAVFNYFSKRVIAGLKKTN